MASSIEPQVARHYTRSDLEPAILQGLLAAGKDPEKLAPADLSPVDEFHTGGRQATLDLAAQMGLTPAMHLLDIGCGIGGPSRTLAETYGCRVTGIDLTESYVRTAEALARRVGLAGRVAYRQASALDLPFEEASFDGALMMHVAMNIADKPRLFAEVHRVLKRGAVFAIFDMMRGEGEGEVAYPVPWAGSAETSFLATRTAYRAALEAAGFEVAEQRDRSAFGLAAFREGRARAAANGGPPPLGLHILLNTEAAQKIGNVIDNLERGVIAPTELICRVR